MKLISIFLFFFATIGHAQMTLDVDVVSRPMDFAVKAMSPEFKAPMKRITWIKINDTMAVYDIDKKGNKAKEYPYYRNKRSAATITNSYTGKLLTQSVLVSSSDKVTTNYKYTASGKYLEWSKQTEVFDKKVHVSEPFFKWIFEYDNKDNIIKKYRAGADNAKKLVAEYFYDDRNRLKEALINGQAKSVFSYDDKGNFIRRTETLNGSPSYNSSYEYDEHGRIVAEHYRNYSLLHNYEDEKLVKSVYSAAETVIEAVDFTYKDGRLSEIVSHKTYLGTHSPFMLHLNYDSPRGSYDFKIEILYDSHKNLRELKYYVNDVYKYSEKFVTEYYK